MPPLQGPDLTEKLPGLEAWGEAEYRLRSLIVATHKADLRSLLQTLACQEVVRAAYQAIGYPLTQEELCPAYDLLRHRRPINFDLLHEARYALSVVDRYYARETPLRNAELDGWLRAIIALASTLGCFEEMNRVGFGGAMDQHLENGPFELPPGPLEAFRSAIRANQRAYPPLLGVMATLNALEEHSALFPARLEVATLLLLPGLVSHAFQLAPLCLGTCTDGKGWVQLDKVAAAALTQTDKHAQTIAGYHTAIARAGEMRLGSRLPAAVSAIIASPVFTSKALAVQIDSVPRTVEKLVLRLEASGYVSALQRSGRLNIWAKR